MKYLILSIFFLFLSSCAGKLTNIDFGSKDKSMQTELLYRLEERDMTKSRIIEYRVHENGLVFKTTDTLNTKIYKADSKFLDQARKLVEEVQKVDYHNYFPWKEDLSEKGDIINIEFPGMIKLNCFKQGLGTNKDGEVVTQSKCKDGFAPKTYLYYTGHEDSPRVFKELLDHTKQI